MEPTNITKQMIDFQRILFNNTYNAATIIQDNSENMMSAYMKQFPWMTEETKKPFNDSVTFLKSAREDYKKTVDQGFDKLEELVVSK